MLTVPSRRRFLFAAGALLAAPSIARAASLMPISTMGHPPRYWGDGIHDDAPNLNWQLSQPGRQVDVIFRPYHLFTKARIYTRRDKDFHFGDAQLCVKVPDMAALYIEAPSSHVFIDHINMRCYEPPRDTPGPDKVKWWETAY